jgi:hypothetical protein
MLGLPIALAKGATPINASCPTADQAIGWNGGKAVVAFALQINETRQNAQVD